MDEDITDGQLIDVRDMDMASLLTEAAKSSMKTALDRVLISNATGLNGFQSSI
jgi:hypothetical protein